MDGADQGPGAASITATLGGTGEVGRKPRWWVVKRTFAWLGPQRRLGKDDEAVPATEAAWIYRAKTRLMVARLAR